MKKALRFIIFISGIVFGVSISSFFFLTGEEFAPKIKELWKRIVKRTN